MGRIEVVVALLVLVVEVYALVTCILTPEGSIRRIPKALWLVLILILPAIGSVLFLGVGRDPRPAPQRRVAPDDDATFLGSGYRSKAALAEQDERIRQMEAELAKLEAETDGDAGPERGRA